MDKMKNNDLIYANNDTACSFSLNLKDTDEIIELNRKINEFNNSLIETNAMIDVLTRKLIRAYDKISEMDFMLNHPKSDWIPNSKGG